MKILLVSSGSGSRGGGEIFLDYLGNALVGRGHDVTVWLPSHPRMDELAQKCARFGTIMRSEYRNTYDRPGRSLGTCLNWATSRRIAREWEMLEPEIIHINKQNLEDGLDLLRAARLTRIPSVCTVHLTQTARYLKARTPGVRDWIARRELSKYHSVFVAVQEARRAALADFLHPQAMTETILNGVPLVDPHFTSGIRDAKRRELGLTDGHFLVLGVGRLVEQKRPFLFLETAKSLHQQLPEARFLWVGDGDLAGHWNDWIARENLQSVITCTGWQSNILPYLLAGDLMLHVAEFEGLPLAIVEAMAAGLPCAVTRNFASEIHLFDEQSVLFLEDVEALATKLSDDDTLAAIRGRARRLVEERLSLAEMGRSYEHLYHGVLAE